jgi:hypothetical protein
MSDLRLTGYWDDWTAMMRDREECGVLQEPSHSETVCG